MQDAIAIVEQSSPKRRAYGPKRDGIDEFSIAGPEPCPHMAFTDGVRISESVGWKHEQWLRIAGPVGTRPRQHVGEREIEAAGRHRAVDWQGNIAACSLYRCSKRILEEG